MLTKATKGKLRSLIESFGPFSAGYSEKSRVFDRRLTAIESKPEKTVVAELRLLNVKDIQGTGSADSPEILEDALKCLEDIVTESLGPEDIFVRDAKDYYRFSFPGRTDIAVERKITAIKKQFLSILESKNSPFKNLKISSSSRNLDQEYLEERLMLRSVLRKTKDAKPSKEKNTDTSPPGADRMAPDATEFDAEARLLHQKVWYHACWNVPQNHLTAFRPDIMVEHNGSEMLASIANFAAIDDKLKVERDLLQLSDALKTLDRLTKLGKPIVAWIPITFATVEKHTRFVTFISEFLKYPENIKNFVLFELTDIPSNLTQQHMRSITDQLKFRCRSVVARMKIEEILHIDWKDAGIHAIGFHCARYKSREEVIMPAMEKFVELADHNKVFSYVLGADSLSLATAAVTSGFRYVEGGAVVPPVSKPEGIGKFSVSDLISPLLKN